jgi:hypothetical protein
MTQASEEPREADGVEEVTEASGGEPSESGAEATRRILESPDMPMLDEEALNERDQRFDEKRKPMGPPLDEDEGEARDVREPEGGEEVEAIDPAKPEEG